MGKKIIRCLAFIFLMPLLFIFISLLISLVPVNNKVNIKAKKEKVYLNTNGVHLYIIVEKSKINNNLLKDLHLDQSCQFVSFGWGDKNFYLNTPNWSDLTFNNAVYALFVKSPTLMHVKPFYYENKKWIKISVSQKQLNRLNSYILKSFETDASGNKFKISFAGYTEKDAFYHAKGKYSCFNTSNTWVNRGFKESGLKACLWTPYDFSLIWKYK